MQLLIKSVQQVGDVISQIHDVVSDEVFATIVDASVSSDVSFFSKLCDEHDRIVIRCAQPALADASRDDDLRVLMSWSQSGWTLFDEQVAALDEIANARGTELLIRPSATGMLSDAICTMSWARRSGDLSCSLLLDPMGWLVGSMMRDIDDHLSRIAQMCVECPKVSTILMRSVRVDDKGVLCETSVTDGDIDSGLIADRFKGVVQQVGKLIVTDQRDLGLFESPTLRSS